MTDPSPSTGAADGVHRPRAVTAAAVVCVVGSVAAMLIAVVLLLSVSTQPEPAPGMRMAGRGIALIVTGLGAVGVWTAMGLLRLRPWARVSVLVFAGLMGVMCLMGILTALFVPLAPMPPMDADGMRTVRAILLGVYGVPLAISVWWLVQFNTAGVKAAFARTGEASGAPHRPIAIAMIGWFNVVGGVFCILIAMTRSQAFVAGFVLTGWAAALAYLFIGVVNAYLGWGLLRLDERARIATIWWFVVTCAHTAYVALTPSVRARMVELQEAMRPTGLATPTFDASSFTIGVMILSAIVLAAAIWPLVTQRAAFSVDPGSDPAVR